MPKTKKSAILIVEDETDLRTLLKDKLESEGFDVLEAENGKLGLDSALAHHPDAILLDVIMPVMDGITMLKELRQDEWGRSVLVIILSNLGEAEKITEGLEKNVFGYLVKSNWEPTDVVALIRKKLAERNG
jgi:two-component system alkaline phosphatase synthesis response regulator PhoP